MSFFKAFLCTLLAALVLFSGTALALQPKTESLTVACVGDSLTYGTGCRNRLAESWPSVLAQTEGPLDLETLNFGVYGQTVSSNPFRAYTRTLSFRQSMGSDADVYLVMLGSNDMLLPNWRQTLPDAYRQLLQGYLDLPQKPEVIVLLPPDLYYKNFLRYTNTEIEEVRRIEAAVAEELGLEIIDLSVVSGDMAEYCIDGGHYNAEGYAIFGEYIYEELCQLLNTGLLARAREALTRLSAA